MEILVTCFVWLSLPSVPAARCCCWRRRWRWLSDWSRRRRAAWRPAAGPGHPQTQRTAPEPCRSPALLKIELYIYIVGIVGHLQSYRIEGSTEIFFHAFQSDVYGEWIYIWYNIMFDKKVPRWEFIEENKKANKKTRTRPKKQTKNFLFSWSLSWSSTCFLVFLLSCFLL